jgi:Zn ribbon nucleic-acid-binding protein
MNPIHYTQMCDTCGELEQHALLENVLFEFAECLRCGSTNDVDKDAIPEQVWTDYETGRLTP